MLQHVLSLGNFRSIFKLFHYTQKGCNDQVCASRMWSSVLCIHQNHPENFKICVSWSRMQSWQQNILHHEFCPCSQVENIWLLFMFCLNFLSSIRTQGIILICHINVNHSSSVYPTWISNLACSKRTYLLSKIICYVIIHPEPTFFSLVIHM